MPARANLTSDDVDELVRRYAETGSLALTGIAFGVTPNAVKYHLQKRGVTLNPEPRGLADARARRTPKRRDP